MPPARRCNYGDEWTSGYALPEEEEGPGRVRDKDVSSTCTRFRVSHANTMDFFLFRRNNAKSESPLFFSLYNQASIETARPYQVHAVPCVCRFSPFPHPPLRLHFLCLPHTHNLPPSSASASKIIVVAAAAVDVPFCPSSSRNISYDRDLPPSLLIPRPSPPPPSLDHHQLPSNVLLAE